jgi:hypothetical protein
VKVGDLVVSARGLWHTLIGILWLTGETKYVHYKHLEVVSEGR